MRVTKPISLLLHRCIDVLYAYFKHIRASIRHVSSICLGVRIRSEQSAAVAHTIAQLPAQVQHEHGASLNSK